MAVMSIEFVESCGHIEQEMVALYNDNQISEKDALRVIKSGDYNDNVLVIPRRQWISLFRDGKE